tara:strand:- start:207 stop:1622 length:1416 start_codon:yes stop_codon:yes gene_type:complete
MTIILNGTTGITSPGGDTQAADTTINGLTVGRGAGDVSSNTAVGESALAANTSGGGNAALSRLALVGNTTGNDNTSAGNSSLQYNTTGSSNTAFGSQALHTNTTASRNSALGYQSLYSNTTGTFNTGLGAYAGYGITTGTNNTALGDATLYSTSTGGSNVAVGRSALENNTTASNNTAVGYQAGYSNTTGTQNVFLGRFTGLFSTSSYNTFVGDTSGYNSTGSYNAFLGWSAGYLVTTGSKNTIIGGYSGNQGGVDIRTANNHIVLSDGDGNPRLIVDSTGDVMIGGTVVNATGKLNVYQADSSQRVVHFENGRNISGDENLRLVLGSNCNNTSSVTLIVTTAGADKLFIYGNGNVANTNNSYGALSDIKLKENVVDATPKLADLMQVKVRSYNLIGDTTKQIGVVAQELETVFPAMIDESPDRDSESNDLGTTTKSVKYSVFVPMLIKAMQEQQAIIDSLTTRITVLEGN